ncbi:hypothetical protein SK128_021382, partial [Halocaridina rubra]
VWMPFTEKQDSVQVGEASGNPSRLSGSKTYSCPLCPYVATKTFNIQRHFRTHTGEKPYACEKCVFKTNDRSSLSKHYRTHGGHQYSCPYCSFKSFWKERYLAHAKTHL